MEGILVVRCIRQIKAWIGTIWQFFERPREPVLLQCELERGKPLIPNYLKSKSPANLAGLFLFEVLGQLGRGRRNHREGDGDVV